MLSSANAVANQSSIVVFPPVETISGSLVAYWDEFSKPHPENTSPSFLSIQLSTGRWSGLEHLCTRNHDVHEIRYCNSLSDIVQVINN